MRKLLLSILFLLTSFLNYSQDSKIKYGIQAGLNYSDFRGYDIPDGLDFFYSDSPAFAFLGGINFEYQIKERLSLKLEINYERKSQKLHTKYQIINETPIIDDEIGEFEVKAKRNYDYLVLPLMVKYNFGNKNSFYVNGGPFIGYLLKSNLEDKEYENGSLASRTEETTNNNNRTDLGLSIGLGKSIKINEKNSIFIEIRENLGLSNTSKYKVWGNGEIKTNSFNLIVGYSLN
ncbi:MAG TPA: porin family protein [Flavobacterium sp.]|uniref:porin family protein n=1 Tax=Flavobacterium sp. TaxID=239 RepID=UPI0028E6F3E9|nr:porin family protein [uncultured Flavobacterium sp.]